MCRALVAALLLALAAPAPARAAERVTVRAAEHDKEGFGRIAFEWPAPVAFEAKLDGQVLTVPVIAELKRPATLRTFREGNVIAVDIVADAAKAPLAKAAAAKPAKLAAASAEASATVGIHVA
jgi:hypothetical protein